MNKSFVYRIFGALFFVTATLVGWANNYAIAQEEPFADDEIVISAYPSTFAKIDTFQKVWEQEEVQNFAGKVARKIDEAVMKELDEENNAAKAYLSSVLKETSGKDSFVEAAFYCYFKYVNGVVLAINLPESVKEPKDFIPGVTLTYILAADPTALEVNKLLEEGKDFEIVKNENSITVGKIFVKDGDELKATVFFGVAKVKDLDKYVLVLGGTQESVEEKASCFKENNEFVVNRCSKNETYCEYIFKSSVLEELAKKLSEKQDDSRAVAVADVVKNIKSYSFKASGAENGIVLTTTAEIVDKDAAQDFSDMVTGGLAVLRMNAKKNKDFPKEAELGVKLLRKVEVSCVEGNPSVMVSLNIDTEEMKEIVKVACQKAAEGIKDGCKQTLLEQ